VGDGVPGGRQSTVAGAVFSEGGLGAVSLPAIELDYLADLGPVAVDLEAPCSQNYPVVEAGYGEGVPAQEGGEALLEARALSAFGLFFQALQGKAYLADASSARVAPDQVRQ